MSNTAIDSLGYQKTMEEKPRVCGSGKGLTMSNAIIVATRHKNVSERICADCGGFIATALDADSRRFFSRDLFCRCRR